MFKKYVKQTLVYLLEIIVVLFFLNLLVFYLEHGDLNIKITKDIIDYNFISKNVTFYAIYQLLVFAILTLIDSSKKDSILMLKTFYSRLELLLEYDRDMVKILDDYLNKLDSSLMLDESHIKEIKNTKLLNVQYKENLIVKKDFELYLKQRKIEFEHLFEYYSLSWRLSFLLRISK